MPSPILTNGQLWAWLAIAVGAALSVWLLSPILAPFLLAAILAYMAREIDAVLAEWLRGQILVIAIMSTYYVIALWLTGVEFALPMRIITGPAVIVPYVGVLVGLFLATAAALMEFDSIAGLHPMVVIFALLAFGHVFGFVGVLLALPASAARRVGLRHLRTACLAGPAYGGK